MNNIINWMGGWPKDGLVSALEWEERLAVAAESSKREAGANRATPYGLNELRELLAEGLLKGKADGKASRLWLAAGADAVLSRLAEYSLTQGDVVLTERLTSRSALQVFRKAGIRVETVYGDNHGMDPEALSAAIALHRPRLVYAAPVCSDPAGAVWAQERFVAVARICAGNRVTLLRDDRQEMLLYDQETYRQVGNESTEHGVISIGQLPPGLVAGLRFGWAAGDPEELIRWFPPGLFADAAKEPEVMSLERQALTGLLKEQPMEPLLEMLRVQSGGRMHRLTDMLKKRRVPDMSWQTPQGGVHLWLKLPEGLDGEALLRGAWIKGLMFQPGAPFYAAQPKRNTLRLTFAYADERQMKLGVSRLIDAMGDFLGRFDIG
ncbi:MAG: aminotransferase class I/II-fold pyridoxal phosphate-dependent enzyme [Cohnella sp.]|nr:aminotransferase class I/II-fold pyridoxal phosphate-dependent enzyme [Cohnella sp.]